MKYPSTSYHPNKPPDNLRRWGKRNVSRCPMCGNNGTLEHILNFCSVSLQQGRFTWRNNTVLNHLTSTLIYQNLKTLKFSPTFLTLISTVALPHLMLTTSRPDLVILNRQDKKIYVLELTCSFESNIMSANAILKYTQLKLDLEQAGYSCSLLQIKVGSRGCISKSNRGNLINSFVANNNRANALECIKQLSNSHCYALSLSFIFFLNTFIIHFSTIQFVCFPKIQYPHIPSRGFPPGPIRLELFYCVH